ncbi:hypothetical protein APHAL10511_005029 [Amanita phalloides]|nr:hypothetical protein APHAL10511_005029 [Amanita phalloides]
MPRLSANIWVAAADGDLPRIRDLVENHSISPNLPDQNTYTPMHAAASYAQLHVLHYLVSKGGDVNITDSDGDTPIYTVEDIATARFLVEHGAVIDRHNNDGISPPDHLQEEFPDVADYLRSLTSSSTRGSQPSQYQQELVSDQLTSQLMDSVQDIMQRAEQNGREPDDELRQAVSRVVLDGVTTGYNIAAGESTDATEESSRHKRQRHELK